MTTCPKCNNSEAIRRGTRKRKDGTKKIRFECKSCGKLFSISEGNVAVSLPNSYTEHRGDGSITFSRLLAISEEDAKSPERIIELCGFEPKKWKVVRCRVNDWNGMDKKNPINHQVKVDIAPKVIDEITFDDVDKFFKGYKASRPKRTKKAVKKTGRTLEMCIADAHIGNGTDGLEERIMFAVNDTLSEAVGIDKIIFVLLGDTLHYDTMGRKTTKGTQLEYGLSPYEMYDTAGDIMIKAIDRLSQVAPVEVMAIHGNHDMLMSHALFKGLEWYYRGDENVTVDATHEHTKYRKIGNSLVLWNHGAMPKKNLDSLIYVKARKEFGEVEYSEIHTAHIHHQRTAEAGGVIIRHLPTITSPDEWGEINGYTGSVLASMSFVWDQGLRNIIYSNVV